MSRKIRVKPGKTESKIGLIGGIIFIFIGIFIIIPIFGLFGIAWTAFAALGVYINYKNAYTEEGVASHEIIIDDHNEQVEPSNNIEDKLRQLDSLYNKALISKEEYDQKRKEILNEL